ncbi:MAG: exo-alpha-sialidase [Planctomycetaceae bacterium]|nr:exo-alpha-sialidase [Planctomycetaceae bacterium]
MDRRILVATRKGLFTVVRESDRWKVADAAFLGDNLSLVGYDPRTGAIYASIHHGHFGVKLQRSEDGGATWREIATPAYPQDIVESPPMIDDFRKTAIPWSVQLIWAFEAGGRDEPGVIWLGTIPGGLFRSSDCGESWELNRPLLDRQREAKWTGGGYDFPGLHSICVDPRDSQCITVAISTGGVWQTRDGGQSWCVASHGLRAEYMPPDQAYNPLVQDAHAMVQCAANPDRLWIQHHNGVFRSVDQATSWQEITTVQPSVFGFAIAVHPHDAETAWTVPAVKDEKRYPVDGRVVVARTRNGGVSFETLTEGLPQGHAYDLTYRHGLAVDSTGEWLTFGSTTGSLWVSEDQGNRWQNVSTHLPPIHCVKFIE